MAIDFPNSPTLDQEFTVGDITWTWDGSAWVIQGKGGGGGDTTWDPPPAWTRPADWLPLPEASTSFKGLMAVLNDSSNYVALSAAGAYTVDWGDGSAVENIASGTVAMHQFVFANIPANTLTSRGYRQCIVTVTPQAGQTFTVINLNQRHTRTGLVAASAATGWLDVSIDGAALTNIYMQYLSTTSNVRHSMLERVQIKANNCNAMTSLCRGLVRLATASIQMTSVTQYMEQIFEGCRALQYGPALDTSECMSTYNMFSGCVSLLEVPAYNTSKVTYMYGMFDGCASLQQVPVFDTALVTNMNSMFNNCFSLKSLPLVDTSKATDLFAFASNTAIVESPLFDTSKAGSVASMFLGCRNLRIVPAFVMPEVTNASGMFNTCSALETVPSFSLPKATNLSSMFLGCGALKRVGAMSTPMVTNTGQMFSGCVALEVAPMMDTATATAMNTMFNGCVSLREVPLYNTSAAANMLSFFNGCTALRYIPALSGAAISNSTNAGSIFAGCTAVTKNAMTGIRFTHTLVGALNSAELDQYYTGLPTVTGQTITVTGNPGIDGDTPSIATAKGWTVTGS